MPASRITDVLCILLHIMPQVLRIESEAGERERRKLSDRNESVRHYFQSSLKQVMTTDDCRCIVLFGGAWVLDKAAAASLQLFHNRDETALSLHLFDLIKSSLSQLAELTISEGWS